MLVYNKRRGAILVLAIFIVNLLFTSIYSLNYSNLNLNNRTHDIFTSESSIPLDIYGNNNWITYKNAGICSGSGSGSDPYVIENLEIDGQNAASCIGIANSDVYFKIKNCTLFNSGSDWGVSGIELSSTENGEIIDCTIYNNGFGGIVLMDCINNVIVNNTLSTGEMGIYLEDRSDNNEIIGNQVSDYTESGIAIYHSNRNEVRECEVRDNQYGLDFWDCSSNLVKDCYIINNFVGFRFNEAPCTILEDNNLGGNSYSFWGEYNDCPPEVPPFNPLDYLGPILIIVAAVILVSIIGFVIVTKRRRKSKSSIIERKSDKIEEKIDINKAQPSEIPVEIHFCKNCGKQIELTWNFCPDCKTIFKEKITGEAEKHQVETLEAVSLLKKAITEPVAIPSPVVITPEEFEEEKQETILEEIPKSEESIVEEAPDDGIEEIPEPIESIEEEIKQELEPIKVEMPESQDLSISDEKVEEIVVDEQPLEIKREAPEDLAKIEGAYCTNCGKLLQPTWKICPYCRFRIKKEEPKTELLKKPVVLEEAEIKQDEPVVELLSAQEDTPEEISEPVEHKDESKPEIKEFEPTEVVELPEYKVEGPPIPKPTSAHKIIEDEDWRERVTRGAPEDLEKIEIKYCSNCGKQLQPFWKICPYCRYRVKEEEPAPSIVKKEEEIKEPEKAEFTVREFPKDPSRLITPEEYKDERKQVLPSERLKPEVIIPPKPIEKPQEPPKPKFTVKEFPKEPSKIFPPKPKEVVKPIPPPEPPKPKENVCPFCGLKNELEKESCLRCGYKLKK